MTFKKPDSAYWDRKFIAYMHDPPDKVFNIKAHEKQSAMWIEKFGLQKPNEAFWKKADAIASGFERGQVPSYSPDPNKNGAVDFLENPVISHPTSKMAQLKISFNPERVSSAEQLTEKVFEFMEKEIGMKPGQGGYSDRFSGDAARFSVARFLYTHLILRFKLAENDVAGLGAFWHRIPADSRFPDHTVWQHNALCSALYSCIERAGDESETGMMVFSITPVQQFIARARKLRDYWTGSMLLSWLAFEGICWVIENLGPDHVLYPSLIDQPLVNEYMKKEWKVSHGSDLNPPKDIASMPNKFLFLIPMSEAEVIAEEIKAHIRQEWKSLCEKVHTSCTTMLGSFLTDEGKTFIKQVFDRQNRNFWDLQWTAAHLVSEKDMPEIERLLSKSVYETPAELLNRFNRIISDKPHYVKPDRGELYTVTHSLVQAALAAKKIRKAVERLPETGEKCHLCGEFEILHHKEYGDDISASDYKDDTDAFWSKLKANWDHGEEFSLGYNLNDNEKLCSICLTKRMAYSALKSDRGHVLHGVFRDKKGFPSTTEIALASRFEREKRSPEERKKIAQQIHDQADERTDSSERYFAILLMDGDYMGKLVNGATLASTWKTVMHPDIVKRLEHKDFDKRFRENWRDIFDRKRLVTPAVHAAISEALGDFSLYGVDRIIRKNSGTLIYAGGDDVCAVLPVDTVFNAAREIRQYFVSTYKMIPCDKDEEPSDVKGALAPGPGKLSINLGIGDDISISAAILICHHKEHLAQMIEAARYLLENRAKERAGRNACAIELRKRSGGSRYFVRKWGDKADDETHVWDSFAEIGCAIANTNDAQVSTSVAYRIQHLKDGIQAVLASENRREMLEKIIFKLLERSAVGEKNRKKDLAKRMVDVLIRRNGKGDYELEPDGLIVAAFMAKGGQEDGLV